MVCGLAQFAPHGTVDGLLGVAAEVQLAAALPQVSLPDARWPASACLELWGLPVVGVLLHLRTT